MTQFFFLSFCILSWHNTLLRTLTPMLMQLFSYIPATMYKFYEKLIHHLQIKPNQMILDTILIRCRNNKNKTKIYSMVNIIVDYFL